VNGWLLTIRIVYRDGTERIEKVPTVRVHDEDLIWFGRAGPGNSILLPKHYVSRRHFCLVVNAGGEVVIRDTGVTSGTYVNGHKLTGGRRFRLGLQDQVSVGDFTITLAAPPERLPLAD
jgi:pSer/pThr/pTyr-binding forkhead associated (FHA) protein